MGRLLDIAQKVSAQKVPALEISTVKEEENREQNLREKRNKSETDPYCAFRAELNAELSRLHEYLIRLRCEEPPKGTRSQQ